MKLLNSFICLFLSLSVWAQEISVVDVKRNIKMSEDDNVYKDFYINAGEGSALRKNLVIKAKRKITIKESPTKNVGDFETVVGLLKVIHVGNKVSVAREFKLTPRDEEPMLEQIGIMTGDKIDLTGSYIDYTKPNYKHKTSENSELIDSVKTASNSDSSNTSPASTESFNNDKTTEPSVKVDQPTQLDSTQNKLPATEQPNDVRQPANNQPTLLEKIIPLPGI